jgi:hypothetical protein
MIIRYALFEGTIHAGREDEFQAFVRERLVPLWTKFPNAIDVRVSFGGERDEGAPLIAMILETRYPNRHALEAALSSDVRWRSREVTGELMEMFTGRIHHHVADLAFDSAKAPEGSVI